MMKVRNRYTRGTIGLPTVLIVLSWLSIWFLWASVDTPHIIKKEPVGCSLTYLNPNSGNTEKGSELYYSNKFGPRQTSAGLPDDNYMEISKNMPVGRILRSRPYEREKQDKGNAVLL